MTSRAIEVFERWCGEHVNPIPFPEHARQAEVLATQFEVESGLTRKEITSLEEEFLGQDLVSEFKDRLDTRATEEIAANAARD